MKTIITISLALMSLVSFPSWGGDLKNVGLICSSNVEANKSKRFFDFHFPGMNNTSHTFWFKKDNDFEWFVLKEKYTEEGGTAYKFIQIPNFYEINSGKLNKSLGNWGKYQHILKQSEDIIQIIKQRITPAESAGEQKVLSINRYNLELTYIAGAGTFAEREFTFNCEVVSSNTKLKSRRDKIVNDLFQQHQNKLNKRKI